MYIDMSPYILSHYLESSAKGQQTRSPISTTHPLAAMFFALTSLVWLSAAATPVWPYEERPSRGHCRRLLSNFSMLFQPL